MAGHLGVLVVYFASLVVKGISEKRSIYTKSQKNYDQALLAYTINVWLTFFVELMMCYLLVLFNNDQAKAEQSMLDIDLDNTVFHSVDDISD